MNMHQIIPSKRPFERLFLNRSAARIALLMVAAAFAIILAVSRSGTQITLPRYHSTSLSIRAFCRACADEALAAPEQGATTNMFVWPERLADIRSALPTPGSRPVHIGYRQPFNRIFADERLGAEQVGVSEYAVIATGPQAIDMPQVGPR